MPFLYMADNGHQYTSPFGIGLRIISAKRASAFAKKCYFHRMKMYIRRIALFFCHAEIRYMRTDIFNGNFQDFIRVLKIIAKFGIFWWALIPSSCMAMPAPQAI